MYPKIGVHANSGVRAGRHKACPYRSLGVDAGRHKTGSYRSLGVDAGRHKAGSYGEYIGLGGRGLGEIFRLGTCYEYRHRVGEACCRRGGVAGAEPPHKGGRLRPTAQKIREQGLGAALAVHPC